MHSSSWLTKASVNLNTKLRLANIELSRRADPKLCNDRVYASPALLEAGRSGVGFNDLLGGPLHLWPIPSALKCIFDCCMGVDHRGIEERHRAVILLDKKPDFRTGEENRLSARGDERTDDALILFL